MSLLEAKIHVIYNILKLKSKRAEICSGIYGWPVEMRALADQLPTVTSHLRAFKVD